MKFDTPGQDNYLAEKWREWDLIDLRGREFLRLLRRASDEGLLPELLQIAQSSPPTSSAPKPDRDGPA